jgi:uncharacterized membrane protein YphA (DoxX/SURF4 family)
MKKIMIAYWIFTALLSVSLLLSSIPALMGVPDAVHLITNHLGYPSYFVFYVGLVKLIGVAAILVPGFPRIKEWAYAGLAFDLISVVYSSISVGDPASKWMPMSIYFILLVGSYVFYHKKLKQLHKEKTMMSIGVEKQGDFMEKNLRAKTIVYDQITHS